MPSLRADAPEFLNIGASTSGASGILGGDARKVPMWTPMEPMDRDAGPTLIPTQLRGDGMPASDVQRVWEDSVQTVTPWPGLQADIRPWMDAMGAPVSGALSSGAPPELASPSASGALPGTIEELIRAAQRVAVLRSGGSTPVWTPGASRAGSIFGD